MGAAGSTGCCRGVAGARLAASLSRASACPSLLAASVNTGPARPRPEGKEMKGEGASASTLTPPVLGVEEARPVLGGPPVIAQPSPTRPDVPPPPPTAVWSDPPRPFIIPLTPAEPPAPRPPTMGPPWPHRASWVCVQQCLPYQATCSWRAAITNSYASLKTQLQGPLFSAVLSNSPFCNWDGGTGAESLDTVSCTPQAPSPVLQRESSFLPTRQSRKPPTGHLSEFPGGWEWRRGPACACPPTSL